MWKIDYGEYEFNVLESLSASYFIYILRVGRIKTIYI